MFFLILQSDFWKLMIIVISIALGKNASDKKLEYKEELRRMWMEMHASDIS